MSLKRVPLSTDTKRCVLVIAPQWVGDAILSLPLLDQLSHEYDAVDVLAMPAVGPVYECASAVRHVNVQPFAHGSLQWGLRQTVAKELRGRYAAAIVLPNSIKSALIPWLAGIPIRRGALGEHRYILLNQRKEALSQGHSMLIQYLQLADRPIAALEIQAFDHHRPRLQIPQAIDQDISRELATDDRTRESDNGLMVICPGAEYGPAKQWPREHFAEVAKNWIKRSPTHRLAILGSAKETETGSAIANMVGASEGRIFQLCGKTKLIQAFGWIAKAQVVITNDSGLMHAAAALDVPTVAVFGSTDPKHTPPHSQHARVVRLGLSCSPCFQKICPLGTTACLKDLPPAAVIREIDGLLNAAAGARAAPDAMPPASL